MNTEEHGQAVDGQCGTCFFAREFGYGPSPSGPEDGVHCVSYRLAVEMDELSQTSFNVLQLLEYGFMDLFRLETVAEETYRCSSWMSKEIEVKEQRLPAPDEAPLTSCPWCGKEYNVQDTDPGIDYETLVVATSETGQVARHEPCGNIVRFIRPDSQNGNTLPV